VNRFEVGGDCVRRARIFITIRMRQQRWRVRGALRYQFSRAAITYSAAPSTAATNINRSYQHPLPDEN